jgi:hypothetical protein
MSGTPRYCGREFTVRELELIQQLIAEHPSAHRAQLSKLVCERLGWHRIDGGLKDMSCRVAMLRMEHDGLLRLPPPRKGNGNGQRYRRRTLGAEPEPVPFVAPAGALTDLHLELVDARHGSHLWNEYIDRYHYLGYQPLPGAQLRYFARVQERVLALLGFGAAAWKTAVRDRFIGWSQAQRQSRLHLVVNNARFLILPWVHSRHLASRLLAMATRRLANDWQDRYGYRPVLVETFVETPRFRGTCYRAANWTYVGDTQGRGKLDTDNTAVLPIKAVWLRPLTTDFRRSLCS